MHAGIKLGASGAKEAVVVKIQAKESTGDLEDCPVVAALEVIGERWTLLVIRDLLRQQARRFQDLELSLVGISPNTLLGATEAAGGGRHRRATVLRGASAPGRVRSDG